MRPYTRSLDPADYEWLPHAPKLREFAAAMTAPHCLWHEHKVWENASIMQQLDELGVPRDARIIDVGSGGMFFPPYLVVEGGYADVTLTDSMHARGDLRQIIRAQEAAYGISMPFLHMRAEDMPELKSGSFDVVMCISTIEHVDRHDDAVREIVRLAKPGGLVFITSDFFRDGDAGAAQHAKSPYRDGQVTAYSKEFVLALPSRFEVDFVGGTDLDYRGDFVNNYSFVNICMRKRAASTSTQSVDDNGKAQ